MNFQTVERQLRDKISEINLEAIIKDELAKNKKFSLYEVSDDVLIMFNHTEKGQSKLNVGFPFPVSTADYSHNLNNLKTNIFIRGEPVRKIQRDAIRSMSTYYSEINSQLSFSKLVKEKIAQPLRFIYIDPYTFIGDSFIGLYFLDSFKESFKVENTIVFSNHHEHLQSVVDSKYYSPEKIRRKIKQGDVLIMPDLLDSHWEKTLQTIREIRDKKVKIIIPGRGLFLDIDNCIITYHYNEEDTLLRNKNIENYMEECLYPFGIDGVSFCEEKKRFDNTFRFFFNPFSSQETRYISPELLFYIYKNLREINKKAEFYLIAGYRGNISHANWLNKFLALLKDDGSIGRININYYSNLSELAEHLEERECGAILTADTSISHMANRVGFQNITIYNPENWDADSLQSLSSSSPAGFCRYFYTQIPIINNPSNIKHVAEITAQALMFFQQDLKSQRRKFENKEIPWLKEIYDPKMITYGIKNIDKGRYLCRAAIKISPLYKLEHLKWD